jgi:hypothetical protein
MDDANMDTAMIIEPGSHDVNMEATVRIDPIDSLIKALPDDYDPESLEKPLARSTAECEPLIGQTLTLGQLVKTRHLLRSAHLTIRAYITDHKTLPDGCAEWKSLSEARTLDDWEGLRKPTKILGSPGLTVGSLFEQVAKASRSKNESRSNVAPAQIAVDFSREFLGQGALYLHRHILGIRNTFSYDTHYAPVIPIIQSSGTGKSKTAVELAKLELGFFTCVRSYRRFVSEPKRDDQVAYWLNPTRKDSVMQADSPETDKADPTPLAQLSPASFKRRKDLTYKEAHRVAIWLLSFADELAQYHKNKWLELYQEEISTPVDVSGPVQAERWKVFKLAVAAELSPISVGDLARRDALLKSIDEKCHKELRFYEKDKMTNSSSAPDGGYREHPALHELIQRAKVSWEVLESILPRGGDDFIHLTIDECGQIGTSNLTCLRSQFNIMELGRSCVLLIDTNTQISMLAGDDEYSSSLRKLHGTLIPCEPFSFLPQDLGMITCRDAFMRICEGSDCSRSYEALKEYLPNMGRPLWADSWLKGQTTSLCYAGVSLASVCRKLSGPAYMEEPLKSRDAIIALLTQRLPLKLPGFQGKFETRGSSEALTQSEGLTDDLPHPL